jgi:hypothetical protein
VEVALELDADLELALPSFFQMGRVAPIVVLVLVVWLQGRNWV